MISTLKLVQGAGWRGCLLSAMGVAAMLGSTVPGTAQEIVQPLPPQAAQDLNDALRELAGEPRNVRALLAAGEAALELSDPEAALGFLRRAEAVSPNEPRIKAGIARAALQLGDPVDAVRLFDQAEAAGLDLSSYADERGLAYDLVGDNGRAQAQYRAALAREDDPDVRRRLALSQSIAGDANGAEATLLPLLQRQDRAAYRTRAFALAILGRTEEAESISDVMLPSSLSNRLTPYLRLMPRLTKAQQAAAANLGQFPTAGQMGRDDPKIASFAAESPPLAVSLPATSADQRLAPAGEPLGRSRRRSSQQQSADRRITGGRVEQLPSTPIQLADATPVPEPEASGELPPLGIPAQAPRPPEQSVGELAVAEDSSPPEEAVPSFSIARQEPVEEIQDLSEVFADFELSESAAPAPSAGAVDITAFEPPRERAEPEPPANPSRHWVQVATGRDEAALAFDWRRISRNSDGLLDGKSAFVATWGETNRLVTGPFDSAADAQEMVTRLKEQGVDSFRFTSSEGEDVKPLG